MINESDPPDASNGDDEEEGDEQTRLFDDLRLRVRPGQKPWLLVVGGRRCVGMLVEVRQKMTIGRAPPADIVLDEEGVSRRHAQIDLLPGGVVRVTDLESSNGVRLAGRRGKIHALRDGERLRLGEAVLTLIHIDDNPQAFVTNLRASVDALTTGTPARGPSNGPGSGPAASK